MQDYNPSNASKRRFDSESKVTAYVRSAMANPLAQESPPVFEFTNIQNTGSGTDPIHNSATSMPPNNDWDLSNLLLLEMGYVQNNLQQTQPTPGHTPNVLSPSMTYTRKAGSPGYSSDFGLDGDIFTLWQDIPDTFRLALLFQSVCLCQRY